MMSWFVIELLTVFAEFLIVFLFFRRFLGKKHDDKLSFLKGVVLYVTILVLSHTYISTAAIAFPITILLLFLLSFLFDGNVKVKLFATILLAGFFMLAELGTITVLTRMVEGNPVDLYDAGFLQFIAIIISRIIVLIATRMVSNFSRHGNTGVPMLLWLSLLTFPLVGILAIYNIAFGFYMYSGGNTVLLLLTFIGLLFANILVFQLFESFFEKVSIKFQNQMLEAEYKRMVSGQEINRRFLHDFDKHVEALYSIAQEGDIKEVLRYLSSLKEVNAIHKTHIHTGNVSIDAIFNIKIQEAREKDIKVHKNILIPLSIDLDPMDVCTLFANAWDNAIEACERILEGQRYIDVSLRYEDEQLRFRITNPTDGKLAHGENYFKTSKPDARLHGVGLGNMKRTVEKYGGTFIIEYDSEVNIFTLIFSI